jgi:hypothetical protein
VTEAEWLACSVPVKLFRDEGWNPSERKTRLFCLACCDRIEKFLVDPRSRAAVEFLERHTDVRHTQRKGVVAIREAAKKAHHAAYMEMYRATDETEKARNLSLSNAANAAYTILDRNPRWAAEYTAAFAVHALAWDWLVLNRPEQLPDYPPEAGSVERQCQVRFIQDIFGNPFRTATLNPLWLTSTALALARGMYDERAFDRMPILADALQDAGCDNEDVLNHWRGPGPHVRGGWVVDLVLGKR